MLYKEKKKKSITKNSLKLAEEVEFLQDAALNLLDQLLKCTVLLSQVSAYS